MLTNKPNNFIAGKTGLFKHNWYKLTNDANILENISGVSIDFITSGVKNDKGSSLIFGTDEKVKMQSQIDRMLASGVIEHAQASEDQFVSHIFSRPKKDGSVRIILNLKQLNLEVEYHHFKMETLQHAIQMMTPGCFMASIDLIDAYYTIPVRQV